MGAMLFPGKHDRAHGALLRWRGVKLARFPRCGERRGYPDRRRNSQAETPSITSGGIR
jgi:hypothetical protein